MTAPGTRDRDASDGQDDDTIRVRSYEPDDRATVIALWGIVFGDDPPNDDAAGVIERKLTVQPELFVVAEHAGAVVGTVLAGFDGVRGWVHHLAVAPKRRRRGIGAGLMRAAERGLARAGCPKLNLQVRTTNREVVAFYESLGYAVEDRVSMGRRLDPSDGPVQR